MISILGLVLFMLQDDHAKQGNTKDVPYLSYFGNPFRVSSFNSSLEAASSVCLKFLLRKELCFCFVLLQPNDVAITRLIIAVQRKVLTYKIKHLLEMS